MKQKSKGVYVSHLKAIKRKATLKVVLQALYWFMVGVAGVLLGQLLVLIF